MTKSLHSIGLVLMLGVCLIGISACNKGKQKPGGKVELKLWTFLEDDLAKDLIEKFEKVNPDITVTHRQLDWATGLDQLTTAIAAGNGPDVGELGSTFVASFASQGQLTDLTKVFSESRDQHAMVEVGQVEGKQVALPWLMGSRVLFYNKAMFKQARLDPSSPPKTWEQWLRAAEAIDRLSPDTGGFGGNRGEDQILFKRFVPLLWSAGGDVLSPDGKKATINEYPAKMALEFLVKLSKTGPLQGQKETDLAFAHGKIGMMISGAWNFGKIKKENPKLDFGVALVPAMEEGRPGFSFAGAEVLVTYKKSKHPTESLKLLGFLMEPDQMKEICKKMPYFMPANLAASEDEGWMDDPRQKVFAEQLKASKHTPQVPQWLKLEEVINLQVEKALQGASKEEVLQQAQEEMQKILDGDT